MVKLDMNFTGYQVHWTTIPTLQADFYDGVFRFTGFSRIFPKIIERYSLVDIALKDRIGFEHLEDKLTYQKMDALVDGGYKLYENYDDKMNILLPTMNQIALCAEIHLVKRRPQPNFLIHTQGATGEVFIDGYNATVRKPLHYTMFAIYLNEPYIGKPLNIRLIDELCERKNKIDFFHDPPADRKRLEAFQKLANKKGVLLNY